LIGAHAYLSGKQWGVRWQNLLAKLVHYDWAHFHNEDGQGLNAPGRPVEIGQWMKEHCRWVDQPLMEGEGAPFRERMLEYWKGLGPQDRWDDLAPGTMPKQELAAGEVIYWGRANHSGRNRVGMMVLALAWWGQAIWNNGVGDGIGGGEAALAAAADWNFMVEDLAWVLGFLADYEDRPGREAELAAKQVLGRREQRGRRRRTRRGRGRGKGRRRHRG
jgi:hypothetical protein